MTTHDNARPLNAAELPAAYAAGDLRGTATDVARRDPDGGWRYVIDNPFGTARR